MIWLNRFAGALALGAFLTAAAHGAGPVVRNEFHLKPSALEHIDAKPNDFTIYFACYYWDWLTGNHGVLNCHFTLSVGYPLGPSSGDPEINGGHEHGFHERPLIYRKRHFIHSSIGAIPAYDGLGKLVFAFDQDPSRTGVAGHTVLDNGLLQAAVVTYPLPEVSGEIRMLSQLTLPPHWYYEGSNHTIWKTIHFIDTLHIGVTGLVELPDPGPDDHYEKIRSPDKKHPDSVAFYIKPEHLPQLYQLANRYYSTSGRTLSLNDMTLPYGGLFDVRGDWQPPHRSHRDGTDADVNQRGSNPTSIPCQDEHKLIRAVRYVLPKLRDKFGTGGNTDSAIYCESGGRIHIDFERGGK